MVTVSSRLLISELCENVAVVILAWAMKRKNGDTFGYIPYGN